MIKNIRISIILILTVFYFLCWSFAGCKKEANKTLVFADNKKEVKPSMLIKSITIPSDSTDIVYLRLFFRSGSMDDPPGKEGLTNLTVRMIAEGGTLKHTYAQILRLLYPMASSIDAYVDKESTVFVSSVHKAEWEHFIPILSEILLEPAFSEEDFKRLKDETLNYIKKTLRHADDELLSKQALETWLYEGHPYGHLVEGTVKGVESITLDDVQKHYKKILSQDRLVIGMGGAVDDSMRKMLVQNLSHLPENGAPSVNIPQPSLPQDLEVMIVEKETNSTAIAFGTPVQFRRGHPDFYSLMIGFSCLGEHRQSMGRLFRKIREARGLNYGDYAYPEYFEEVPGTVMPMVNIPRTTQYMSIWIRPVQDKHAIWALTLAFHELRNFIKDGLKEDEFIRTRGFLEGYTRVLEEHPDRKIGYALDDLFYGISPFLRNARERWNNLTLREVNDAIGRNISLKNLKIVIVTSKGQEIKENLVQGTIPEIIYDTPKPKEVLEEDKVIQNNPIKIPAEKIKVIPVDSLFE